MIIKTKRSASMLITDTTITALAWLVFFYQFTKGVVVLISDTHAGPISSFFGITLNPTSATLILCGAVCIFNATIVIVWTRLHKQINRKSGYMHPLESEMTTDILADHFSVSRQQLGEIQDSRVTIVYHSPTGGIDHLEVGHLHEQETALPIPQPAIQVA